MTTLEPLQARAKALHLHGLLAHWPEAVAAGWVASLLNWEEQERARRSLERRLGRAHLGRFKPLCDFDWTWPKRCDRVLFEALMTLDFLKEATNVVLVGPNGVGKTTRSRETSPTTPSSTATPSCSPPPASCSATSPPSTVIPPCAAGCAITRRPPCSSSTRSATSLTQTATPTCCSS